MATFSALTAYYLFFYYYYFGSNKDICNPKRIDMTCQGVTQPSCVYYQGETCNSSTGYCQKTVQNYCEACNHPSIVDYRLGTCNNSEIYSCLPSDRNVKCANSNRPVCGFSVIERTGAVYYRTYSNGCTACNRTSVGFYTKGRCWLDFVETEGEDNEGRPVRIKKPDIGGISVPAFATQRTEETNTSNITIWKSTVGEKALELTIMTEDSGATKANMTRMEKIMEEVVVSTEPK